MKKNYREWLDGKFPNPNVAFSRFSNTKRVERYYGDLDDLYVKDRLNRVLHDLAYSSDDQRQGVPNPSLIPFSKGANICNGLNTLRSATRLYVEFRDYFSAGELTSSDEASSFTLEPESHVQQYGVR